MTENKTIFDVKSIDRKQVKWENYLEVLTPVEQHGNLFFKREDFFAPLGYGSVNGAKLRQLIYLFAKFKNENPNGKGVLSGAVSGSPQHSMSAIVARHFGLECTLIVGTDKIAGNRNLEIAAMNGASFVKSKVGYAKTLESKVFQMAAEGCYKDYFPLETNITVSEKRNEPEAIREFHRAAMKQVQNIPDHIERLLIPCGSAISSTSIMAGLIHHKPKSLREIVLFGIGNVGSTDLSYLYNRLELIDPFAYDAFSKPNQPDDSKMYQVRHYNLNGEGFCVYADLFRTCYHNVWFHPRYEGKVMSYLLQRVPELIRPENLFWIIGSEPQH